MKRKYYGDMLEGMEKEMASESGNTTTKKGRKARAKKAKNTAAPAESVVPETDTEIKAEAAEIDGDVGSEVNTGIPHDISANTSDVAEIEAPEERSGDSSDVDMAEANVEVDEAQSEINTIESNELASGETSIDSPDTMTVDEEVGTDSVPVESDATENGNEETAEEVSTIADSSADHEEIGDSTAMICTGDDSTPFEIIYPGDPAMDVSTGADYYCVKIKIYLNDALSAARRCPYDDDCHPLSYSDVYTNRKSSDDRKVYSARVLFKTMAEARAASKKMANDIILADKNGTLCNIGDTIIIAPTMIECYTIEIKPCRVWIADGAELMLGEIEIDGYLRQKSKDKKKGKKKKKGSDSCF